MWISCYYIFIETTTHNNDRPQKLNNNWSFNGKILNNKLLLVVWKTLNWFNLAETRLDNILIDWQNFHGYNLY